MCGFLCVVNAKGFETEFVRYMNNVVAYRGPDGEGYAVLEKPSVPMEVFHGDPKRGKGSDSPNSLFPFPRRAVLAMGHRRLAILDLSEAGRQPMPYDDRRYWITYNGEIYNYRELREELRARGHVFSTQTDTEVILAAWKEWGAGCQERFNGMWAFVLYDTLEQLVFASRDRFGIKPLYYWFAPDNTLCMCSEIKQLTAAPGWKAILNPQATYDYLFYSFTDHLEETMFRGVYHLPPGHCIQSPVAALHAGTGGALPCRRWYTPVRAPWEGTFDEAARKYGELFEDAVRISLRSDVPVGSALSGGLDSTAIVCQVNRFLGEVGKPELQKTFSCIYAEEHFSEKRWMDIVVAATGVDARFVCPAGASVGKRSETVLWHMDEPYQSQSTLLGFHVFEKAREEGVPVLLNGQGADEHLSGYGAYSALRRASYLKRLDLGAFLQELRETSRPERKQILLSTLYSYLPRGLKTPVGRLNRAFRRLQGAVDLKRMGAEIRHPDNAAPNYGEGFFGAALRQLTNNPLPKYLRSEDRISMAHSVEARVPYLDHRLVEHALRLPVEYHDARGEMKRLLRRAMGHLLPEAIRMRADKKGFITPEEIWLRESNTEMFRSMLRQSMEASQGVIRPSSMLYLNRVICGDVPFDYSYWRLIALGLWMKVFDVRV